MIEYSESLTSLFNGNYKNICNKDVYGNANEGRSCKRDFGTNTCQKLYNLSDDYRMMVTNEEIAYNNITKKNSECTNTDYSYECQLKLGSNKANQKLSMLKEYKSNAGTLNSKVIKHDNKYYMGIKDACELLYNN